MSYPGPPPSWGGLPDQPGNGRLPELQTKLLSEYEIRPIRFIERPFLLDSTFHLLVGKKAAGKGVWLVNTAARVTRGELGPKTGVFWLSMSEDSYAVDLAPRMLAAGGELAEVNTLASGEIRLPEQMRWLEEQITQRIGLVVIDPLVGALGAASANNDWEIRPMLQGLNRLADEREVMVIGIRHFSIKAGQNAAIASVLGSTAWVDVPRMVLGVFADDEAYDMRHLFVLAGNRTPTEPTGVMFHVGGVDLPGHEEPVPKAEILGISMKDPDELLAARGPRDDPSRSNEAQKVLLRILLEQPTHSMLSDVLDTLIAQETGLATKTIRNLRSKIGSKGTGLLRVWRERPGEAGEPWWVGLTEAGRILAEGRDLLSSPYPASLDPLKPVVPGISGSSLQTRSPTSRELDPRDPVDPQPSPRIPLPPTASSREREMWEKRGWGGT